METVTFSNEQELQELYDKYDEIINITLVNLYTLSKEKGEIILSGINRFNKDHLYVLRVALIAKDVYGFPLKIRTSFWNWLCLNWRMRKLSRRVPRDKSDYKVTSVDRLLEFMYPPLKEHMGHGFEFGDIYDTFYGKELD